MSETVLSDLLESQLLDAAIRGMKAAKVVWGFSVGAAVVGEDNRIYEGCNVESEVAGLGICAERCAIDHAVIHGNRKIRAVAVVAQHPSIENLAPCGACRQYIKEFAESDLEIVTAMVKDSSIQKHSKVIRKISELLPFPYRTNAFYIQTKL
ncbi:MAG: cytidine deaminase [archaeon]